MGQRAKALNDLSVLYQKRSEMGATGKITAEETTIFNAQVKAIKDLIAALNDEAGIKPQAPKPKGDTSAVTEEKVGGKTVARGKITGQAQAKKEKAAAKPHGDWKTARTEVKRGKYKGPGPNKGKTVILYDDGSKSYAD